MERNSMMRILSASIWEGDILPVQTQGKILMDHSFSLLLKRQSGLMANMLCLEW